MSALSPCQSVVAAVGMFDGVHAGHSTLIRALTDAARARGARSMVLTFMRHPLELLRPADAPRSLCSADVRRRRLLELGVDDVEFIDFTPEFRALTGREFLRMLKEKYGVSALVVGFNNHFGSDRLDAISARTVAAEESVEIIPAPALALPESTDVSSSCIRAAIAAGDVEKAAALLGRPYTLEGRVGHGAALGREIGFPTANLRPDDIRAAIPAEGVYAVDVEIPHLGLSRRGITNIGRRPSIDSADGSLSLETHILDFDADIYGRTILLHFLSRLRDEQKFPDMESLRSQLSADALRARSL
ncbi:MAG: riboflavin biosynthesis protein RibF [Muribaculaceae bacterium]|nr:riboflavin biosynthesis protein RibF [Muribaculaceae bacterium]